MTTLNILGWVLLSLPFLGLGIFSLVVNGVKGTLLVVGVCMTILLLIAIGVYLVTI